ncbi:N-acetylglutaminylglutamine amidotransferase [Lutibaculum baratangense]|uniref:asparagine synthase (glutamine-hydrolyzing) n=1 Tax=Lutibaculum baratangense AMV1 TaxID=631454 RepID=V4RHF3_9HYPH|nr:N-acetylglutaminylglutamine amidotransferase [Lutibaculum baratangense]ESR25551.1 Asparagine synthetase [Lutibaculum baratangense AMV1]
MCGLCGEVTFDGSPVDTAAITRMADKLAPRGPDGSGMLLRGRAGLAHRRLTIIDLSLRAEQPMVDSDLGLSIAFNGCIYNYPQLRQELAGLGYRFFSSGDTEVLIKGYHAWGLDFVNRLNGMFAFAILERDSGRLVLGRDRFGIKPLYYSETGKRLRFASSLPAILASGDIDTAIDPVALHHYMSFHAVVPPPHTMIRGIRKLPPATIRVVEADGRTEDKVYWRPEFARTSDEIAMPEEVWRERVEAALRRAVDRRMVADVPVGVLLSGGVDSSLIVALLAEAGQKDLMTFSIGFESANNEEGDEFKYSDLVAQHYGTKHHKIFVESDRLIGALPGAIQAMSEPMVSYDNVAFYMLSQEVSKHIKVVQSGQGADEVFAGYHWYPPLMSSNDLTNDYAKVFFDRDDATLRTQVSGDYLPDHDASREFVASHFAMPGAETPVDKALRLDTQVMLVDDPVKRVDNMTMSCALEARVPFLDHELVELAARVPTELKLKDGGKGILKDVARKVLPREVIDRPKGYFPVPVLKYLQGPYLDYVQDTLNSRAARERGIFNRDYVDELLANPSEHITPLRGSELWQVAVLEMWLQSHLQ